MSELACMIEADDKKICIYPSEKIVKLLGKEYTILIIVLLGNRKKARFNEIAKNLGNPSPNLLSYRLQEMEEAGLVLRNIVETKPITVEYSLTEKGWELRKLLIPIFEWIEKMQN